MRHDLFSFPRFHEKEMTYKEFLDRFYSETKSGQIVIKDGRNSTGLIQKILMNITLPEFYHDVAEIEGIELLQGGFLIDKPKYEKKEQVMCVVSGKMEIKMVAHVYRQEIYAG